jgi:hypothetical protein
LVLQFDARPASGELTGAKIGFEDAKTQPPGRIVGLHGKLVRAANRYLCAWQSATQAGDIST